MKYLLAIPTLVPAIVNWLWIHGIPLELCSWMSTAPNHIHRTSRKIYHSFNKGSIFKMGISSAGSRCHQAVLAGFVKSDQNLFSVLLFTAIPLCFHPEYSSWLFFFIILYHQTSSFIFSFITHMNISVSCCDCLIVHIIFCCKDRK